jgi:uncharacterized RDD family membrane protein YckC
MVYEGLLLFAVAFLGTWIFQFALAGTGLNEWKRHALQLYLISVFALYFSWFWVRGGQTLAMKAWHIRLVMQDGSRLRLRHALLRFFFATCTVGGFALGVLTAIAYGSLWLSMLLALVSSIGLAWAWVDRDGQFLHDRLAGTRLRSTQTLANYAPPTTSLPPPQTEKQY